MTSASTRARAGTSGNNSSSRTSKASSSVSNNSSSSSSSSSHGNGDEDEVHMIEPFFVDDLTQTPIHKPGRPVDSPQEYKSPTHEFTKGLTHEYQGSTHEYQGSMREYQGLVRVSILHRMSLTPTYPKHLWFQGSLPALAAFRQVIMLAISPLTFPATFQLTCLFN